MITLSDTMNVSAAVDFEHFFQKSVSGFVITDPQGAIIKSNLQISDWVGISEDEMSGRKFSDLLTVGSKIYFETHLWPLLRIQGSFDEVLLELYGIANQRMSFIVSAVENRDENDKPQSIYYIISKAQDRILYEKNLQNQKQIAESKLGAEKEMVALREQLIAVLGHDLRNPLASVLFATEMLAASVQDENHLQLLGILTRSGLRMNELIGTIMDFAKSRLGGGLVVEWQNVNLKPTLQQVVDELKIGSGGREIISNFNIEEPVYCDADRIGQLVSNLLANSITHGAVDAPIILNVSHKSGVLEFSVKNKGEKIPDDLLQNLFEPFTREGKRKSQNGLGLGLFISSEIARAHNATLTCTSTEEETSFNFYMSL